MTTRQYKSRTTMKPLIYREIRSMTSIRTVKPITETFIQVGDFLFSSLWPMQCKLFFFLFFNLDVRYMVTVKLSDRSPAQFRSNLSVNILANSYCTGWIVLNKSNALITECKKEVAKTCSSISSIMSSAKAIEDAKVLDKAKLFEKGKPCSFLFEERDTRNVRLANFANCIRISKILNSYNFFRFKDPIDCAIA